MSEHPDFDNLDQYFGKALAFELHSGDQPEMGSPGPKGARLLHGKSPRAISDRLMDGDPLEFRERSQRRLAWHGLLMDKIRVAVRSVAYVSYLAARDGYRGTPPLEQFINAGIDEAITSIIEEDWSGEKSKAPIDPKRDPYASISLAADADPAEARKLTLEFNLLPPVHRRPLYAVLIENTPLAETAERFGLGTSELRTQVRALMARLTSTSDEDLLDSMIDALEGDGQ